MQIKYFDCGRMNNICEFCKSKNFKNERTKDGKIFRCCMNGKVVIPSVEFPNELRGYYDGKNEDSKHFLKNIRQYNSSLAFASLNIHNSMCKSGPYAIRVHGQIYHLTSKFIGTNLKYAELYFIDAKQALEERISKQTNELCKREV